MDHLIFHVEDFLHDHFVPGCSNKPVQAEAAVFEPTVATAAYEPALTFELG